MLKTIVLLVIYLEELVEKVLSVNLFSVNDPPLTLPSYETGCSPPKSIVDLRIVLVHQNYRCFSGFWRNFNCVFGVGDVSGLKGTSLLFANKFDMTFDARPVVCLRKWLDQRKKRYDKRNPNKQFQVP